MLIVRLTVILVAVISNSPKTTDNITVRAGLDLQSEQWSYASWSMWRPLL